MEELPKNKWLDNLLGKITMFIAMGSLTAMGATFLKANTNEGKIILMSSKIARTTQVSEDNKKILCLMALNSFEHKTIEKDEVKKICTRGENGPSTI